MESTITKKTTLSVHGVLSAIIKRSSPAYDIVYFYGDMGPVTAAIDQLLCRDSASQRTESVLRLNADDFIEKHFHAINSNVPLSDSCKNRLCNCSLFVFEGIDKTAGLQTVEQTLFGLFDWLLEHNIQLVITGNLPVSHMDTLAPRIRAQLEGGISCQIIE